MNSFVRYFRSINHLYSSYDKMSKKADNAVKYFKNVSYTMEPIRNNYKRYFNLMSFSKKCDIKILDIGCGSGRLTQEVLQDILPKNFCRLMSIDYDYSMIKYASSLVMDPRISFHHMDITTSQIQTDLKYSFDLILSSYCFMYVVDIRKALKNCHLMLKENGEVLLMFMSDDIPLYCIYKEMMKNESWMPYLKEYEGLVPPFSGERRDEILTTTFGEAGLKVLAHEFKIDPLVSKGQNFLEVTKSMDTVFWKIPNNMKPDYSAEFDRTFCKTYGLDFNDHHRFQKNLEMYIPTLIVYAVKM